MEQEGRRQGQMDALFLTLFGGICFTIFEADSKSSPCWYATHASQSSHLSFPSARTTGKHQQHAMFYTVQGMQLRTLCMQGKHSAIELHLSPLLAVHFWTGSCQTAHDGLELTLQLRMTLPVYGLHLSSPGIINLCCHTDCRHGSPCWFC